MNSSISPKRNGFILYWKQNEIETIDSYRILPQKSLQRALFECVSFSTKLAQKFALLKSSGFKTNFSIEVKS